MPIATVCRRGEPALDRTRPEYDGNTAQRNQVQSKRIERKRVLMSPTQATQNQSNNARYRKGTNVYRMILGFLLLALLGGAAAQTLKIAIDDANFDYYEKAGYDYDMEHAYITFGYADGVLTYYLSNTDVDGAFTHSFPVIAELSDERHEDIWGDRVGGERWLVQKRAREDELDRLRARANFGENGSRWEVIHAETNFRGVMRTYDAAFTSWGFTASDEALTGNIHVHTYRNGSQTVQVQFLRHGSGVKVRFLDAEDA